MSPNNKIDDEVIKEIQDMTDKYSLGYIAKKTGLHVNTVRKYAKSESSDNSNSEPASTNIDNGM